MKGRLEIGNLLLSKSTSPNPPLNISSKVEGTFGFWCPKGLLDMAIPSPVLPTLKPRVASS